MHEETLKILNYIKKNGNFEKPTAQVYYRDLIKTTGVDAEWDLIKFKMRYLRRTHAKAENLRLEIGDKIDSEALKDKIKKICPFYHQMSDIFGAALRDYDSHGDDDNSSVLTESTKFEISQIEDGLGNTENNEYQNASTTKRMKLDTSQDPKRLSTEDIDRILFYIMVKGHFELPNSKEYYQELKNELNLKVPWTLIQEKIQYLKCQYEKVDGWRRTNEAQMLEQTDVDAFTAKLYQICKHYDRLSEIFNIDNDLNQIYEVKPEETYFLDEDPISEVESCTAKTAMAQIEQIDTMPSIKVLNSERLKIVTQKLEFEKLKFNKQHEIEERRLQLEEERIKNELTLKKMELAQKERLAKYEIDLKYGKESEYNFVNGYN